VFQNATGFACKTLYAKNTDDQSSDKNTFDKYIMWWTSDNLDKPIKAKDGTTWEFLVWHGTINSVDLQRVFFWDKKKTITGMLELKDGATVHRIKLKDKIKKLANDKEYRDKYICDLKFPIEKYY